LPRLFSAEVIACWICEFWLGMEFADLLGVKEEQATHRGALDAVQSLLESLDERVSSAPRTPERKAAAGARRTAARKPATKRSR
jgi:hypothetical protein